MESLLHRSTHTAGADTFPAEFAAQNFDNSQHIYNSSAAQPSLIETKTLLTDALRWLDSTGYIERYFWYGAMYNMVGVCCLPDGLMDV